VTLGRTVISTSWFDLPEGSSLLDLVGLQLDLSEVLAIKVDTGTYNSLHPLIREQVLGDDKVIHDHFGVDIALGGPWRRR
jgi:hypothetical protein